MKHALFVMIAVMFLASFSGCLHNQVACDGDPSVRACGRTARCWPPCNIFGCGRHGGGHLGHGAGELQPQQPPVAAITYPYYTVRGPRDFFQRTPSPIGP